MSHLGYPDYFSQFIGVMKVLGVIVILIPGFRRLKEWAYAGLFFDLVGAIYSFIAVDGFNIKDLLFMLIVIIFLFVSYFYFHKRMNNTGSRAM
jgi:hypothetical protein